MSTDWLEQGLPMFIGGKDKSVGRKLIDHIGGPEGFRKLERVLPDGRRVIVTLRGDMAPKVEFYDKPQITIQHTADYIEENYLLRTADYPTKYALGTDRIGWLINTPFLNGGSFNPHLVMPSGTTATWRDEYFYPPEAYKFSTDGLYTLTCVRKFKQVRLTNIPALGTILAAVAHDVGASHYSELHTIVSSLIYRVNPVKRVPVTIDNAAKVIEFKPPPAQIVFPNTVGEGVNPFDDIEVFGNAWHGKRTTSGLLTPSGVLQSIFPFNPNGTYLYHHTYYIHFEGLQDPPAVTAKESTLGMEWYRDIVMYGWDRKTMFDPSGFGRDWLYRDDAGVVHRLVVTLSVDENQVLRATVKEGIRFVDGTSQTYTHVSDAECENYFAGYLEQVDAHRAEVQSARAGLDDPAKDLQVEHAGVGYRSFINLKSDIFFSPDGKKCCVVPGAGSRTQGYLRCAIEFEASGGTGELGLDGLVSVSWRAVTEVRDSFLCQTWNSGFNGFYGNQTHVALPNLGGFAPYAHYEWADSWYKQPMAIGYTKANILQIDTIETWITTYSSSASELAPPWIGTIASRICHKTQLNHALGATLIDEYDYEASRHVLYELTTSGNPDYPSTSGYYLYENLPREQTTISADQIFAEVREEDLWTVIRDVRPTLDIRYEMHTDTLLLVHAAVPPTYQQRIIVEAIAYGERVSTLIGVIYSPGSTKISYNPRTGEVSIDEQATFT